MSNNGTDISVRDEIKRNIKRSPVSPTPELAEYMKCERCKAPFYDLYISGVGDHLRTILCERCFHTRKGVPYERIIVPLVAMQAGINLREADRALTEANDAYIKALAEASDFG